MPMRPDRGSPLWAGAPRGRLSVGARLLIILAIGVVGWGMIMLSLYVVTNLQT